MLHRKGSSGPITFHFPPRDAAMDMRWKAAAKIRRPERYGVFFVLRAWTALTATHAAVDISEQQLHTAAASLACDFGAGEGAVDPAVVRRVILGHSAEASPVAAFAGGVLAVEVMKVLQCKSAPSFVFLAVDGLAGHAQSVDPRMPFGSKYTSPGTAAGQRSNAAGDDEPDVLLVGGEGGGVEAGEEDDCVLLD